MSELLRNQKFGVEVEFTGITRSMAAKAAQSFAVLSRCSKTVCLRPSSAMWAKNSCLATADHLQIFYIRK